MGCRFSPAASACKITGGAVIGLAQKIASGRREFCCMSIDDDDNSKADEALVAKLRAGDRDALAAFIDSRRPQLTAFIDRRLGAALRRKIEVDDLFQEVSAESLR